MFIATSHKGQVVRRKAVRAELKAERREQRAAEKVERIARGERGPAIDWDATTTGAEQFPSAYDDGNPIVAGVGRTLSRGLR
jgi:hypothetical protein